MKLYFSPTSPYVRKVRIQAIETGLDKRIELVDTVVAPTKANDAMASVNPLVKVPALIADDGTLLYDSRVICEYLDGQHQGVKTHPAGAERWRALRQQATADGILDAAVLVRYETWLRPKELNWTDWIDGQMRKVRGGLAALDREAEQWKDAVTIGAIAAACALGYLDFRYADEGWRGRHANLARWYDGFSKRPSVQQTQPR